jgi:hypothetical protein
MAEMIDFARGAETISPAPASQSSTQSDAKTVAPVVGIARVPTSSPAGIR